MNRSEGLRYLFNPATEDLYEWVDGNGKVIFFERDTLKPRED